MDEDRAGLVRPGAGSQQGLVERLPHLLDLGAVGTRRGQLGHRRPHWHVDLRRDPEHLGSQCHALRVVAGTRRDDAGGPLLRRESTHPRVGAADLEAPGALQVFALEEDIGPDALGERPVELQRSRPDHLGEHFTRGPDVRDGHGDVTVHGAQASPRGGPAPPATGLPSDPSPPAGPRRRGGMPCRRRPAHRSAPANLRRGPT